MTLADCLLAEDTNRFKIFVFRSNEEDVFMEVVLLLLIGALACMQVEDKSLFLVSTPPSEIAVISEEILALESISLPPL